MNYKENRPWGNFENLLDVEFTKVKIITVKPFERPSYQYHHKRSEHWVIVKGNAVVVLDDKETSLSVGEHVFIPIGVKHRIENRSDEELMFIEVQCGTYFGEDDIVRLSDDYKRS